MQVSAEIRWFWPDQPPARLEKWFVDGQKGCVAGGGLASPRVDVYLLDPGQSELGLKVRNAEKGGQGIEVKGLVERDWAFLDAHPFIGTIELWTKWSSKPMEIPSDRSVAIRKQRWLRKFNFIEEQIGEVPLDSGEKPIAGTFPKSGCNVELTRVTLPTGNVWWTLGFEAFGTTIVRLDENLAATAKVLAARAAPPITGGKLLSYPAWISEL